MARRKTSRKTTSRSRKKRSNTFSRLSKSIRSLSPERKMDIIGVFLIIMGAVSMLGFLGKTDGGITGWIIQFLSWISGVGAIIFPFVLIFIGLWFVARNEKRFPMVSVERLLGIISIYLNLLSWIHFFSGGGWELAAAGGGGGYLGAIFERLFVLGLGDLGAVVVLIAWILVALAFTFDLSIPDLFRKLSKPAIKTGEYLAEKSTTLVKNAGKTSLEQEDGNGRVYFPKTNKQPEGFLAIDENTKEVSGGSRKSQRSASLRKKSANEKAEEIDVSRIYQSDESSIEWQLPSLDAILNPASQAIVRKNLDQDRAKVIEETLASFSAPVHVVEIHRGPTFTQFGLEPDFVETRNGKTRVRVNKITSLADDIALALAAPSIRIQAPVPGRRFVGIEVPNEEAELVSLREGFNSQSFKKLSAFLKFVLGKDVAGKPVALDLAKMPHLLIAGTTGSGKSVCINSILSSFLMQRTPSELRLVMVDPKRVELTGYNGIPHLLTPVIVDTEKVVGTLQWMSREMDSRYKKFAEAGARNINDYNAHQATKLPYIVVVIDELADLMMMAPEETERNLNRLAQLARATGIHVIIATQRPSTDVITGMIKANFPARISFAVVSGVDSRVILDQPGAERLIGRGDLLFQAPDSPAPVRLQGVFVANDEIKRLVQFWKQQHQEIRATQPEKKEELPQKVFPSATVTEVPLFDSKLEPNEDPLLEKAIALVRKEERASISMLQRKLRIGYTRSARMVDRMEELGIVGIPDDGLGTRPVIDFGGEDEN